MPKKSEDVSYESMIDNVEKLIEELGKKDISLDEAVEKYKKGLSLIEKCTEKLERAEKELRLVE